MKILSIIVPSYNMEQYLPKCLGSLIVAPELMEKLEVLVVNDGSKDRTSEIAHEFEAKWPQTFKVIDKENGNYGSCINAALMVLCGKYVKVLDADDWFDSVGFSEYLKYLLYLREEVDLIISDYIVVNGVEDSQVRHRYTFDQDKRFSVECFLQCRDYLPMHAYTYQVRVLQQLDYEQLEGVSYTDSEWVWLPIAGVASVSYFPHIVYCYLRGREGQTMDPAVRDKNKWMYSRIALHAIEQIERRKWFATDVGRNWVDRQAKDRLLRIYYNCFFDDGKMLNSDLQEFDNSVLRVSERFHALLGQLKYARMLPYPLVRAWRQKWLSFRTMIPICEMYSAICYWLARRGGKK